MPITPNGALVVPSMRRGGDADIRLSIVLPTYNESKNLREMIRRLTQLLENSLANGYEIIVVDDDSPDRTWELAESLALEYPCVKVMRREKERGLSTAVIRGWQLARGEVLGVIDADLQHPPEVLLALTQAMDRGGGPPGTRGAHAGGGGGDGRVGRRGK
jgi:dolichol-phosphate mannosyltransferase